MNHVELNRLSGGGVWVSLRGLIFRTPAMGFIMPMNWLDRPGFFECFESLLCGQPNVLPLILVLPWACASLAACFCHTLPTSARIHP